VVRVWEANPPADVKGPLEWVLLSALPAQTLKQIKERRDWYACRWLVEQYHDVEKNGCSEEDRRFAIAEAWWPATCYTTARLPAFSYNTNLHRASCSQGEC